MEELSINEHTVEVWGAYRRKIGFVPDPMILRAGEIFLNGSKGSVKLDADSFSVWNALHQNIASIVDFFDMVVTRSTIPLINYWDTYDRTSLSESIEELLADKICKVEISLDVYQRIKEGALLKLAAINLSELPPEVPQALGEMSAFGYDWKPGLFVYGAADPMVQLAGDKLSLLSGTTKEIAHFLLGGLIFSGFSQASETRHYIQPKRSRFYLAFTAVPQSLIGLNASTEDAVFAAAEASLRGTLAETRRAEALPPVLPYLLAQKPQPSNPGDLLRRALEFPSSREGRRYMNAVDAIREDGVAAMQTQDMSEHERRAALDFLAPYSKLDVEKSRSLEIKLTTELFGLPPGGEASFDLGIPTWLKLWWNDKVPFGGMRKTLRRMWMAKESYNSLFSQLFEVWSAP
jgi:hypothetical protein